MAEEKEKRPVTASPEAASGADPDNTLLPMLVAGMIMIVVGAIVVMAFV